MAQDPLQTRLCEEYGCEYPIIAFAHTRDVTVAVSNAGGIGMLGQSTVSAEEMRTNIRWVKERVGDRPFGVDITIPSSYVEGTREELEEQIPQTHWDFIDRLIEENEIPEPKTPPPWGNTRLRGLAETRAKLEIMMEERIPIFASGLGSPAFVLNEMHDAGVKVWGLIGLARQAARELDAGTRPDHRAGAGLGRPHRADGHLLAGARGDRAGRGARHADRRGGRDHDRRAHRGRARPRGSRRLDGHDLAGDARVGDEAVGEGAAAPGAEPGRLGLDRDGWQAQPRHPQQVLRGVGD